MDQIRMLVDHAVALDGSLTRLLSTVETSPKRVITLRNIREQLERLSLKQEELLEEALSCIEHGCHRASIVLAWSAFMDFLHSVLESTYPSQVKNVQKNWSHCTDFREFPDSQIIEVAGKIQLLSKGQVRILLGSLNQRHECAHPSCANLTMNDSLGFVSGLLSRMEGLGASGGHKGGG